MWPGAAVFTCGAKSGLAVVAKKSWTDPPAGALAWLMRLPPIAPEHLSAEQRDLYDDMVGVIKRNFGELIARRQDGALIGPFNGWLHFRGSDGLRGP